jgi:tetratricopeptide (TPR) repeat protein
VISNFEFRNENVPAQSDNSQFAIRNPVLLLFLLPSSFSPGIRHDPFNIALIFGCWGALVGVGIHSCFDFPFRTPANGILLAILLGLLVAASGMRFHTESVEHLIPVRSVALAGSGRGLLLAVVGGLALFLIWTTGAGVLATQAVDRAVEVLKAAGGGKADKPWVVETSKNRQALKDFELALALDPMNPEIQNRMARFKTQLAMRAWGAGLSPEGKFIPEIPDRARVALRVIDDAIRLYAGSVRVAPPYAVSWSGMGWTYGARARIAPFESPAGAAQAVKDAERALLAMRQAIAMDPNNRLMHQVLADHGFFRLQADRPPAGFGDPVVREGLEAQRKAVELDPTYLPDALDRVLRFSDDIGVIQFAIPEHAVDALFAARLLEEQERWPQAKALHQRAIALAPDDAKPLYYREYAEALTRRGEDAEVRAVLDVVLRFDPQNLELRLAQASVLARLQMVGDALQAYQAALDLATAGARDVRPPAPSEASAPRRIRIAQSREDQAFAAMAARFPGAKRVTDPLALALAGLAGFHHAQGRDDLAVPLWEKAAGRSPDDAAVIFGLAKSYDAVGAWGSALEHYKKAIELNKASLDYRLTLADRYFANEMTFQAIGLWREILVLRPTLIQPRLSLAGAYIKIEQFPEALREYERVLQLQPNNAAAKTGIIRLRGRF